MQALSEFNGLDFGERDDDEIGHIHDVEIWYVQPGARREFSDGYESSPWTTRVADNHTLLGRLKIPAHNDLDIVDLDIVYAALQAEQWSPNGEARELIEGKGLVHTSMSVGDIIRVNKGEDWACYMVDTSGFTQLWHHS